MSGRGNFFDENVKAIKDAGGFVDLEWLKRSRGLARVEKAQNGAATMSVELRGGRTIHLHSPRDPAREAARAIAATGAWGGRHAVLYGAGCGHFAAAFADIAAAVTVLECCPDIALAALEEAPLAGLAARGVLFFMGPGEKIVPPVMKHIGELEKTSPRPVARLYVHQASMSALPAGESCLRAALCSLKDGIFIAGLEADPRTVFAFEGLRKRRLRGQPLTDFDMGLLFAESADDEARFNYFDSQYIRADNPKTAERILLISLSSIGDVVTATSVFGGIREAYPRARIVFLTETPGQALYERCGVIDRVMSYSRGEYSEGLCENATWAALDAAGHRFAGLLEELRAERFDAVFNLHPSMRSGIIAGALNLAPENTMGFSVGRDVVPRVRGNMWTCAKATNSMPAGLTPEEGHLVVAGVSPKTRAAQVCIAGREETGDGVWSPFSSVTRGKKLIGINPCSNVRARMWGLNNYVELCGILSNITDHAFLVFGGPSDLERQVVERICGAVGERAKPCAGAPPDEAAWAARECELFITNDTGPMHFCGAAGARCLVIAGPSLSLPYTQIGHIAAAADLPCIFCGPLTRCETRECMEKIGPAEVAALAGIMLGRGRDGALEALAGTTEDGRFPHPLYTSGTYSSMTPRFNIRLRDSNALETAIAAEWTRIAVFNAMHLMDAGALESRAHPAGLDSPGLGAPISTQLAVEDVKKRYSFFAPDPSLLKHRIDAAAAWFSTPDESAFPPDFKRLFTPFIALRNFLNTTGMESNAEKMFSVCEDFLSDVRKTVFGIRRM